MIITPENNFMTALNAVEIIEEQKGRFHFAVKVMRDILGQPTEQAFKYTFAPAPALLLELGLVGMVDRGSDCVRFLTQDDAQKFFDALPR
jgi:hypothetical protein